MKIGIIGIGDIAQKAYLPVLSRYTDIELYLCTRNANVLSEMAETYQIQHTFQRIEDLINSGIEAAFVHTSTESHEGIVDTLLDCGIHVFVDKPISYDAASAERLMKKAQAKGLLLMVGFNRRFAPSYEHLKELSNPNLIIVEKHRANHPDDARIFIFDDFIHVIDTLLNLFPYPIEHVRVEGKQQAGQLYHVILQLEAKEGTAIGIMNRDAGINEENVKVFSSEETRIIKNINEITYLKGREIARQGSDDWEPMLQKRGFHAMTRKFIDSVRNNHNLEWDYEIDLQRHLMAEKVVQELLK